MRASRRLRPFPWLAGVSLTVICILSLSPVYWMITTSFKSSNEIGSIPSSLWPRDFSLDQYRKIVENGSLLPATSRSLAVALSTMAIVVVLGSFAAYAATHLKFRARRQTLSLSLITQLLPQAATLVPIFVLWSRLGLVDTLPGLVLVYVAFQLPVAVWIITAHFLSVPTEVVEAASVDGSGSLRTLVRIVIPMAAPGVAAVAIWCMIAVWSEFLFGLVLLSGDNRTVPVALSGLIGEHATDSGLLLAGATIAALPPLILFFFVQRYFTSGIAGAVKG